LWNYEIGTRTDWLDRTLELDATAFYIDWKNIQVPLGHRQRARLCHQLRKAKNYGLESTVLWHPVGGWTLQGNVTYLDATLSQAVVSGTTNEPAGATLPGASKWNLNATVRYDWSDFPCDPRCSCRIDSFPRRLRAWFRATYHGGQLQFARRPASGRYDNLKATVFSTTSRTSVE